MKLKLKLLTILCLSAVLSYGQSIPSLTTAPDARSAAMGGVGTATSADAYSIYWNTAKSLFAPEDGAIAYSYVPKLNHFMDDFRMHSVAGYYKIDSKNAVMGGFRYFMNGKMDFGQGEFRPADYAVELGYARWIAEGFSLGAAVRYLRSDLKIVDAENAVAFDLGAYYTRNIAWMERKSVLAVGINLANFGTKMDDEYLPAMLKAGGSLGLPFTQKHELSVAADFEYQVLPKDNHDWDIAAGAEYWYNRIVALRAGYHWGDVEKGNSNYFTFGCGLQYYHLHADFSYLLASDNSSAVDKTYRLTLGVDLGIFGGKK